MKEELKALKWETYEDVREGFLLMIEPLRQKMKGIGHIQLGSHGAVYDKEISQMETFSRLIWGIGPFLSQNDDEELAKELLRGISVGTDPENPHYWGELANYSQKFVEMASICLSFLLAKEKTWDKFSSSEQENIASWLLQINERKIPKNNWRFFRILVNMTLKKLAMPYSKAQMDEDFELIESCSTENGWYFDGKETQVDYYIPWAFHFYSLIYVKFMADDEDNVEKERCDKIRSRATAFAQQYQYWFDKKGEAVPFGRSLTYRFAQSAFWAALAFADIQDLDWTVIKGLYSKNMQAWMSVDIFDEADFLTVGYHYQNLNMAEGYNAAGSPYWAFKSFISLAIPKAHPFWTSPIRQPLLGRLVSPESRSLIEHVDNSEQVLMYPAGQIVPEQSHAAAKYGKFVYSTLFGFSVPKSNETYAQGAFDCTLAVSEDSQHFQAKGMDEAFEIGEDFIVHDWQAMVGVKVRTTIIPAGAAHVRIHQIETEREITVCDGGFSSPLENAESHCEQDLALVKNELGTSLIQNHFGFEQAAVTQPEPNTNLFFPRTLLPYLQARLTVGEHLLVSLVAGGSGEIELPVVRVGKEQVEAVFQGKRIKIELK